MLTRSRLQDWPNLVKRIGRNLFAPQGLTCVCAGVSVSLLAAGLDGKGFKPRKNASVRLGLDPPAANTNDDCTITYKETPVDTDEGRTYAQQKAALTRIVKTKNPEKLISECKRVITEWNQTYWPDDWTKWQRALDDVCGWPAPQLDDLT